MDKYTLRPAQELESSGVSSLFVPIGLVGVNRLAQVQVLFLDLKLKLMQRYWC